MEVTTRPSNRRRTAQKDRIAVIGAGIAGLSAAWLLSRDHKVSLFEANDYAGGHSHTLDVEIADVRFPVDTGFIVYNPQNYPNLTALFDLLHVPTSPSRMSFSVSLEGGRFEYAGGTPLGLIAQPANLVNPTYWQMLAGIVRFYMASSRYIGDRRFRHMTLGQLLAHQGYSAAFVDRHLAPMGAAIWSSDCEHILDFPARQFIRFFDNHGLTRFAGRPEWRTVAGGSRRYVDLIIGTLRDRVHLSAPVARVTHDALGTLLHFHDRQAMRFDQVVFACHADQALRLIEQPDPALQQALGAVRYRDSRVVLHTDIRQMPRRRLAWASWNFIDDGTGACMVSYWMNRLQPLPVETPVIVTLNPRRAIDPRLVLAELSYSHPVMDTEARRAQQRIWQMQGNSDFWFCGAWLGDGFHEDGIQAGLATAEMLGGRARPWQLPGQNRRIGLPDTLSQWKNLAA